MILGLFTGFFWPALWASLGVLLTRRADCHSRQHHFWVYAGTSAGGGVIGVLFDHAWWHLAGYSFWIAGAIWYLTRKRRDRAKAWFGAKSRALRDALVRKARELSQPRPVLRPIPQGASYA